MINVTDLLIKGYLYCCRNTKDIIRKIDIIYSSYDTLHDIIEQLIS